jgi:hypothetical protein
LTIGGGAVTIVVAFGLSNTFFFILRSAGMWTRWLLCLTLLVILVAVFAIATGIFIRTRKKKVDLYPEILRVFVLNREKIENFIGMSILSRRAF